jgi:hypothetical protein
MPMVVPTITVYFGLTSSGGDFFTLDDPVKGVLDGFTYRLAGDVGTNVAGNAVGIGVRRGRNRELDEFDTGEAVVVLENFDRIYDGLNAAGIYYGDLTPGKRITIGLQGQTVFDGTIDDWDVDWPVNGTPTATIRAIDALGELARTEFDLWYTSPGDTAGPRLHEALNRPEIGYAGPRDFDAGVSLLQEDVVSWSSNGLNYAQLVVKSDGGRLFASRDGTLTFRDRHNMFGATTLATFRDDLTGIEFYGITTQTGSELLYTRVGVDREGGILQTANDTTAQTEYGVRPLSLPGLLLNSDSQSLDMAHYLLDRYKEPLTRIASVTVNVSALAATDAATVTALDIGDQIQVVWTPRGVGPQVDQTLAVEGVDHDWSSGQVHMMTLRTSLIPPVTGFILDDPVLGVLDVSALAF